MAESKSLREAVEQIRDDNKKHFGTKMPSDGNLEKEQTLRELTYSQMIMGSLASMIWGVTSKDKDSDIKSLLGKSQDTTIYGLIKSIKNVIINNEKSPINTKTVIYSIDKQLLTELKKTFNNTSQNVIANVNLIDDQNKISDLTNAINRIVNSDVISSIDAFTVIVSSIDTHYKALSSLYNKIDEISKGLDHEEMIVKSTVGIEIKSSEGLQKFIDGLMDDTFKFDIINKDSLEELKKELNDLSKNNFDIISKDSLEKLSEELKKIKPVQLFDENAIKLINDLSSLKTAHVNVVDLTNQITNLLNSLGDNEIIKSTEAAKTNIGEITNFVKNNKTGDISLENLFDQIKELFNEKDYENIGNNVKSLDIVINSIISVITFDSNKINNNGLNKLISITDPSKGEIKKLLDNLEAVSKEADINYKNLNGLGDFFESMSKLGDIGLIKRMKMRSNLKYFSKYLVKLLPDLMKELDKAKKESLKKEHIEAMAAIGNLFMSFTKIGELSNKQRTKMHLNLKYIKMFIMNDLMNLINEFVESANKANKESAEALKTLSEIFDKILKIADFKFNDLIKLEIKLSYLNEIIKEHIIGDNENKDALLQLILGINIDDKYKSKIDSVNSLFEMIHGMNENIPGVRSLLISYIKLQYFHNSYMPLLQEIINIANGLPNVVKTHVTAVFSHFNDDILSGIDSTNERINEFKFITPLIQLISIQRELKELSKVITYIDSITNFSKSTEKLNKALNKIPALNSNVVSTIKEVLSVCVTINKNVPALLKANIKEEDIKKYFENVNTIYEKLRELIDQNINTLNIDKDTVSKIEETTKLIKSINSLAVLSVSAKIGQIGMNALVNTAQKIKDIVNKIKSIRKDDLNKAKNAIKSFSNLMAKSAGVLLLGAFLMKHIKISNLIAFTVSFGTFMWLMSKAYNRIGKTLNNSINISKTFVKLLVVSGGILMFGSLITRIAKPKNAFGFVITLSGFLLALTGVFWVLGKTLKNTINIAKTAIELVKISGLVLIVGGLAMKLINPKLIIGFGIILAGFIGVITGIFILASKFIKRSVHIAKEFTTLIAVSTLCLIAGALFMSNPKRAIGAFAFAMVLGTFILAIVGIYKLAAKELKFAIVSAVAIGALLLVSTFVLMIGAVFMSNPKLAVGAIAYALLLDLFIFFLLKAFRVKNGVKIAASLPMAAALATVTIVSTFALLVGGGLIGAYPGLILTIPAFGLLLWGFTKMMTKVLGNLSRNAKRLMIGAKLMAILGGITLEASIVFRHLINTSKMIDDWKSLIGTVVLMGGVLLGLYGLVKLISSGGPTAMAYMAIGEAILAGLIGCVALIGIAVKEIAKGLGEMAKVSQMDVNFGNLAKLLLGFVTLVPAMMAMAGLIIPIGLAALSMTAMRSLMLDAADVIQAYANLKIPIYEGDKVVGYKIMNQKDFEQSGKNIKSILTTLFDTVNDIYKSNPEMFEFSLTSLLTGGGGTVFGKVAAAGKGLGIMLSILAFAVQQWADLKIPIYEGEKIIGYKTIDNDAFVKASENIKSVVTCLGQAVIDVYKNAPKGMFDFSFSSLLTGGGGTVFGKVAKSLTSMGEMLASVAEGLESWADLKIPMYKENSTEVSGYITLTDDDFVSAAENIKRVVSTLAQAVLDIYDERQELFEPTGWFGFGSSTFSIVSRALNNMGQALGSIANGVKEWADLKIPVYNGTEVDHYLSLTSDDFVTAGENIKDVVTCLAGAIIDVYDLNPKMFDDEWFTDSPFSKVVAVMGPMGKALGNIANAVKDWADLKIPIYEGAEISGYITLSNDDFDKVGDNISSVVTCLVSSIAQLYNDHEEWFDDSWFTDSDVAKVLNSIAPLGSTLKDIADAVQAWADLKIPIYTKDSDGKAIISGYVTMGNDTFVNVTRNIDKVVTSLIRSVASLYEPHKDWFDGTGIFGLGDSPIGKVLGSIVPLGKTLKDIADAVQAWADLKIPIYGTGPDGNLTIVDYKTLGNDDFVKATANIDKVVTSLVKSIAALYYDPVAKKEKWFEKGFLGLTDSPIGKVLSSIAPLGNVVKGIADGIVAFAEFKIPTYTTGKDGEAIISGYTTLSDGQIVTAGKNIGKIVKHLAKIIGSLYNDPEAKAGKWFDRSSWWDSETPFSKVVTSLEPMGNMIGTVAEGIKTFADLKIPVYGKNRKGELVITDYKTLANADFAMAAFNIGLIITTLGNAIASVVKENEGIFDDVNSPVIKASEAIKNTGETLSSVAGVIGAYANGEFPTLKYDKEGKLVPGKMIRLNDDNIKKLKTNVNAVLTALGQSIIDVYNNPENKEIFDSWEGSGFKQDAPAMVVANSIKAISDSLNNTLEVIGKIIEMDFNTIATNMNAKDGLVISFKHVMQSLASIVSIVSKEAKFTLYGPEEGLKWDFTFEKDKGLAGYLSENVGKLSQTGGAVKNISSNVENIFNDVKKVTDIYNNLSKSISTFNDSSIETVLTNTLHKFTLIGLSLILFSLNSVNAIKDTTKFTNKIEEVLSKIFKSIVKINTLYNDKDTQKSINSLTNESFISNINKLIHSKNESDENDKGGILNILCKSLIIKEDYKLLLSDSNNSRRIIELLTNNIRSLFTHTSRLINLYNEYEKNINSILETNETGNLFVQKIEKLLNVIKSVFDVIISDNKKYLSDDSTIKLFSKRINNTGVIVKDIQDLTYNIIDLSETNTKLSKVSFDNVESSVKKFLICINNIKSALHGEDKQGFREKVKNAILTSLNDYNNDFAKLVEEANQIIILTNELIEIANKASNISSDAFTSLSTGITNLNTILTSIQIANDTDISKLILHTNTFIKVIDDIDDYIEFLNKANSLRDGILNIYTIAKSIESNSEFNNHTEKLKDYIKAINSIDLTRLSSLTNFVNAMNLLSMRLGNLDNLTDVIANKLSMVLYELVNELRSAEASIKNAHLLQEKRKKLIDDAMDKIKGLMDQPMIVEISQAVNEDNNTPSEIRPSGIINGKKDDGSPQDANISDDSKQTTDYGKTLDSPDNDGKENKKAPVNRNKAMTFEQFQKYMQDVYSITKK